MEEGVGGSLLVPAWERQNGRWPAWETCPMPTGQENLQNNDFQKSSNVCNRLHKTNFMALLGSFMIGLICGSDSEKITLRRSYEFEMHLVVESGNAFHLSVLQKNESYHRIPMHHRRLWLSLGTGSSLASNLCQKRHS